MRDRNTIRFKHRNQLPHKALLFIHQGLLKCEDREVLLASNTRDPAVTYPVAIGDNECARILRTLGIANIDRNRLLTDRENCFLMEYRRPHVGQFAQFLV